MSPIQNDYLSFKQRLKFFVGRVGPATTNLRLREYFGAYGNVHIAKVETSKRSGKRKGFGYVIFTHIRDAVDMCRAEHRIDGLPVYVDYYTESVLTDWHRKREMSVRLQIAGIPGKVSEYQLQRMLENMATVLVSNSPRHSKGSTYLCNIEIERTDETMRHLTSAGFMNNDQGFFTNFDELKQIHSKLKKMPNQLILSLQKEYPLQIEKEVTFQENLKPSIDFSTSSSKFELSKHSKYEFIQNARLINRSKKMATLNYRFNIVKPEAVPVSVRDENYARCPTDNGVVMMRSTISRSNLSRIKAATQ